MKNQKLYLVLSVIGMFSIVLFVVLLITPDDSAPEAVWPWLIFYVTSGMLVVLVDTVRLIFRVKVREPKLLMLQSPVFYLYWPFAIFEFPVKAITDEIRYRRSREER